jgi:hypothetical protein
LQVFPFAFPHWIVSVPAKKDPLVALVSSFGVAAVTGDSLLVATSKELLRVDVTRVIKQSERSKALKSDLLGDRFEAYMRNNRVEEFSDSKDRNDSKELIAKVVRMSEGILDDKEDSKDSNPMEDEGEQSSLLLHQRLNEKYEKHRQFIEFLRLSKAIQLLPQPAATLIRQAMEDCVTARNPEGGDYKRQGYTVEDVFFRQVTKVDQLLSFLPLTQFLRANPVRTSQYLYESNLTFLVRLLLFLCLFLLLIHCKQSLLRKPWELRKGFCEKLGIEGTEYTVTLWNFQKGLRQLVLQHNVEFNGKHLRHLCDSGARQDVKRLGDQLRQLDEFLLDTYQFQLEEEQLISREQRMAIQEMFEQSKKSLILEGPFLAFDREAAQDLAERFRDYNTIIQICNHAQYPDNIDALNPYLIKYQNTDFPALVYEYFREQGRYHLLLGDRLKVIQGSSFAVTEDQLSLFLQPHPRYAWIHSIRMKKWETASNALLQDSFRETDSIQRRSTLLGLSKLAKLAGNSKDTLQIDHARFLNDYQKVHEPDNDVPNSSEYFIEEALSERDYEEALNILTHTSCVRYILIRVFQSF